MSKAHDPHWRYIGFRLQGPRAGRHAVKMAIQAMWRAAGTPDDLHPLLTRYEHPHGIIRVHHHQVEMARALLPRLREIRHDGRRIEVTLETLGMSGTLRALTERLGVLQARPPRPERGATRA